MCVSQMFPPGNAGLSQLGVMNLRGISLPCAHPLAFPSLLLNK